MAWWRGGVAEVGMDRSCLVPERHGGGAGFGVDLDRRVGIRVELTAADAGDAEHRLERGDPRWPELVDDPP
jgi:hypothetical protein